MNQIAQLSPEKLPRMTYQQKPVITTEAMAGVFQVDTNNLRKNFSNNEARFEEGKHFFRISGDELSDFRLRVKDIHSQINVSGKIRALMLWTERGAARHAKMLNTDTAWEVFERMEDFYFGAVGKEIRLETSEQLNALQGEIIHLEKNLISEKNKVIEMLEAKIAAFPKRYKRRPITIENRKEIYRLHLEGLSSREISRKVKRSDSSVRTIVNHMRDGLFNELKEEVDNELR